MKARDFFRGVRQRSMQQASNRLAEAYSLIASDLVADVFEHITELVRRGERVRIPGFGTFERKVGPLHVGAVKQTKVYARVRFRAAKSQRWEPEHFGSDRLPRERRG
jgi:nucleoid DNA-binding protein